MSPLIASVVPDVSGIDKIFDYLVPGGLAPDVSIGCKVRVTLNGRRVPGWVVALGDAPHDPGLDASSLLPILSVSGLGVEPELVQLTASVARRFFGPWRAVLSQASAPRVRGRTVHAKRGKLTPAQPDPVSLAAGEAIASGGGLVVVPPLASALSVVSRAAMEGPVLVVCPTQRMAQLGAASLRRKGLTTAVVPEEWEAARAGVDVVIGARSAVFAPCPMMAAVVVIDEHDELLHEERSPTWNARDVARERAATAQVPCLLTSPVPSAEAMSAHADRLHVAQCARAWPRIEVVDLDEVPVAGSLLGSTMLAALADRSRTSICVLNTKGAARVVVCRSCRAAQGCRECAALLSLDGHSSLACPRCGLDHGQVCTACGRTSFLAVRGGIAQLARQLRDSLGIDPIEVSADTDTTGAAGSVYVGTEALLHRMARVDTVVFADIDRDLGVPRMTASREVLSLLVRAARLVGEEGRIIVQTRRPGHPVMAALASGDVASALMAWQRHDLAQREMFALPPFARLVRVGVAAGTEVPDPAASAGLDGIAGVEVARFGDHLVVKTASPESMDVAVAAARSFLGQSARVHADPQRY